jgi:hypothetical protein
MIHIQMMEIMLCYWIKYIIPLQNTTQYMRTIYFAHYQKAQKPRVKSVQFLFFPSQFQFYTYLLHTDRSFSNLIYYYDDHDDYETLLLLLLACLQITLTLPSILKKKGHDSPQSGVLVHGELYNLNNLALVIN